MKTKGADIYRSKGILAFLGDDRRFVFQGVHMLVDMGSSQELGMEHANWQPGEKRMNKLCFIGRNLDRKQLEEDIKACIFNGVKPEPGPVPTEELQFPVGATVLCMDEEGWEEAVIVKHWYREDLW
jgi:hypothetical protein